MIFVSIYMLPLVTIATVITCNVNILMIKTSGIYITVKVHKILESCLFFLNWDQNENIFCLVNFNPIFFFQKVYKLPFINFKAIFPKSGNFS